MFSALCGMLDEGARRRPRGTPPTRDPSTPGRLIMEHWRLCEPKHTKTSYYRAA